jgi:hypothetical protein
MRISCATLAALGACLLLAPPPPRCAAFSDDQAVLDPARFDVEMFPEEASVHGKYGTLLRRIHCPEDLPAYHQFTDYGMYTGTSWHKYTNLPPGYWVYVYPDWYIWRDCTAAPPGAPAARPAIRVKAGNQG